MPYSNTRGCEIGADCQIWGWTNLYGCEIGDHCMIGPFVEIQDDVTIGDDCRIQSHSFVCSLVDLGRGVFVGHGAMFVNDRYSPDATEKHREGATVGDEAIIGTNATIMPVEIGKAALVGAGAVVTRDVPERAVVAGNPAQIIDRRDEDSVGYGGDDA